MNWFKKKKEEPTDYEIMLNNRVKFCVELAKDLNRRDHTDSTAARLFTELSWLDGFTTPDNNL